MREMRDIARTALQSLKHQCQTLMELHVMEALEESEIKQRVNLPKSTFYRHWKTCYKNLREQIQQILRQKREEM
jgi:DNA-directed RNA polymerase specialized sigma24 family protein